MVGLEVHDEEGTLSERVHIDIIDLDDIGVGERRGEPGLVDKGVKEFAPEFGTELGESDIASRALVVALEDLLQSPHAEQGALGVSLRVLQEMPITRAIVAQCVFITMLKLLVNIPEGVFKVV